MLVVLEGPDGAGKTTLARELVDEISRRYPGDRVKLRKTGPPTSHPLVEYEDALFSYRPLTCEHLVLDRWHLGELVYPEILGRPTRFDAPMAAHVELFLRSRGALLVWVTASSEVIAGRVALRGDDYVTPGQAVAARAAFQRVAITSSLPRITYDTTSPKLDRDELERVRHLIVTSGRHLEDAADDLREFVTYVGTDRPGILLFGDVRGTNGSHVGAPAPAFVPYPATSGHYLLRSLGAGTMHTYVGDVGLANACDVDEPARLVERLNWPSGRYTFPLVVALGRRADAALTAAGIPHRATEHPQYVRRFHHAERDAYRRDILYGVIPPWRRSK